MFAQSLLAAALTFSPWYGDVESEEHRRERLSVIAEAIDIATLHAVCSDQAPEFPALDEQKASDDDSSDDDSSDEAKTPAKCTPIWRGSARNLAFLLLSQAHFETRLAAHIHAGECRTHLGECDGGKAATLWQLQYGPHLPKERWERFKGADLVATTRAAYEAARVLSRGRNQCGTLEGAISLYATGSTCTWKPAEQRAAFSRRLSARY